jgi:hypothetical protein
MLTASLKDSGWHKLLLQIKKIKIGNGEMRYVRTGPVWVNVILIFAECRIFVHYY